MGILGTTLKIPNSFFPNFGKFLKIHLASNFFFNIWVRGWGKMAPQKDTGECPRQG